MSEWLDEDGYLTEAALDKLKAWPYDDINGALDFVRSLWHRDHWCGHDISQHEAAVLHAEPGDKFLRCATGGWSGNEALIAALNDNRMLRSLAWRFSARGGLHIYPYKEAA